MLAAFLLAFPALFSIVNPIAGAFIFRGATGDRTHLERTTLARRVGIYSLLVMLVALWAGSYVLAMFGISIAALRIAGGIVLALFAWELLGAPEKREDRKQEQATDAGGVDLDPDQVALRIVLRGEAQRLSIAEADLQHALCLAAKCRVEVALVPCVVEPEPRPQLLERTLLRRGEAALTQHEAAHLAMAFHAGEGFGRGLGAFTGERISHRRSSPPPASGVGRRVATRWNAS